ncbi:MAG: hypothetical protein COW18_02455 [Zetaproteobacteria bacterium CG12_big_fil_rev_8_21_14_0_65_54_13]|nr:MAG: hypothetical protein COX55_04345 [Zetaproteobacteria bacterium CG23_combo_of_CG06-09_8_20_14_all_54_7]PIW51156.1 MAG: hypothetical protein COW18_02455 [Zetaproteobacteria bacterium CG12_big_fil_rev_8_21_14_0_65_54_13]
MLENSVIEVCNRSVVRVTPSTPIAVAIRAMSDMHTTSVVVCEHGTPAGILTARDLPRLFDSHTDLSIPIEQVMAQPVTTCHGDITLLDALDTMLA